MPKPSKLIAIEEHYLAPGFPGPPAAADSERATRMMNSISLRLEVMDRNGIEMQVMAHSALGPRAVPDIATALAKSRTINDALAKDCRDHPTRFGAFATLPMLDPKAAADELERAVTQLGHKGTMIYNMSDGRYLDGDEFSPIWERAEALDVPIYLHPAPPPRQIEVTAGYPGMDSALWGWTAETGGHALRIVLGGVFDRFPKVRIVLGHMGETLPYLLWRLDSRFQTRTPKVKLKKLPSDYVKSNILVTTSGMFADVPLQCAIAALGIDSVMFSVDYPYEKDEQAVAFINAAPLSQADLEKVAHGNAERLLKL